MFGEQPGQVGGQCCQDVRSSSPPGASATEDGADGMGVTARGSAFKDVFCQTAQTPVVRHLWVGP